MTTTPRLHGRPTTPSDVDLVTRARDRDSDAIIDLWTRHSPAATVVASAHPSGSHAPEEIVHRAFVRLLDDDHAETPLPFRKRLYRAVHLECGDGTDPVGSPNILRAFRRLPARSQDVLWYSVAEQFRDRHAAEFVNESLETFEALRWRSLHALRTEWLAEVVSDPAVPDTCAWLVEQTASRETGELDPPSQTLYDTHVNECESCQEFIVDLAEFPTIFRDAVEPLFAGAAAADLPEGN